MTAAALAPFATGSLTHPNDIRDAWRNAMQQHHVDRGGSAEAMQLIDLARKTLLAAL